MLTLNDFPKIAFNLTNGNLKAIRSLHFIVFEEEGEPRQIRNNLRLFQGFDLVENSPDFAERISESKKQLKFSDLISVCFILDIDYDGDEEELIKRICNNLTKSKFEEIKRNMDSINARKQLGTVQLDSKFSKLEENELVENTGEYYSSENINRHSFSLSFRDVEDSVCKFTGKDGYPINKWIIDFEELADMAGWSEFQKLIFAKKLLGGAARLLVMAEKGITSWPKLKEILKEEFETKTTSAHIHQMLVNRKKRNDETVEEYVLVMREIGSRANVEMLAVIEYIIKGIPDVTANKVILYGAKNFIEFKGKVELYNQIKSHNSNNVSDSYNKKWNKKSLSPHSSRTNDVSITSSSIGIHCFNCGQKGHKANECPSKGKGAKCYKCNNFGHISTNCSVNSEVSKANARSSKSGESLQVSRVSLNYNSPIVDMMKPVAINDVKFLALVDTGSDVNIIKSDCYFKVADKTKFLKKKVELNGIGGVTVQPLGLIEAILMIDDGEYLTNFYVVPDTCMKVDALLGKEFISMVNLTVSNGVVSINKNSEIAQIMNINISDKELCVGGNISETSRNKIYKLIHDYRPTFTKSTGLTTKVILKDDVPIYQTPRRLAHCEVKEVNKHIEDWLSKEIIRPSKSEYASPVVLVKKKDGGTRLCVDYRKLNSKVIRDRYPLPNMDVQLDKLQNSKFFSTIDLENGFFHVPMDEHSCKYTAFVVPGAHYEFLKTPFGFCNAPAVFQRFVNSIFSDLIKKEIVLAYMDDVIVLAANEAEMLVRLEEVFAVCADYGLSIKWKKCMLGVNKVTYLGHEVSNGKIEPSEFKIKAVVKFPVPTTIHQVHSFLGLTGYFRRFIKDYAIISKPLSDLLKKNSKFKFQEKERMSFEQLKRCLTSKPVLNIYNFDAKTELHTDACSLGYGAVLMQEGDDKMMHPIHYMSRKTSDAEMKFHSYELEVLAVVEALKKFRCYLLGIEFKVITDCKAFEMTMAKKDLVTRVARWIMLMQDYNFSVEHRPGVKMKHADALSRNPSVMVLTRSLLRNIEAAQQQDESLRDIFEQTESGSYDDYLLEDNILYKMLNGNKQLVIPDKISYEIIRKAHEIGHFGIKKTEELIEKDYFIKDLHKKVENFISSCVICILNDRKRGKAEGLLNPIPKGSVPFDTYHVDHLGPLESTKKGYKYIFVIIDGFTKFCWLYPTKTLNTEEVITKLKLHQSTFGSPRRIISDKHGAFISNLFEKFCEDEQIEHLLITTGVPRGNGQVERIIQTVIGCLRKLSAEDRLHWYKKVPQLQRALNASFQRSISAEPFRLLFGVAMRKPEDLELLRLIEEENRELFKNERDEIREAAKLAIIRLQEENRRNYNKRRKEAVKYKKGDIVAIKKTQFGQGEKLGPLFLGPYKVIRVGSADRYEVERVGEGEGPRKTSSSADNMKQWTSFGDE